MSRTGGDAGALLVDIQRRFRGIIDKRLKPIGLSQAKWRALIQISNHSGELTQTELATLIGIETPTLVRLLDRLQKDGWIKRYSSPTDRRVKLIKLGGKAETGMKIIRKTVDQTKDELYSVISTREMEQLEKMLAKMRDKAELMQKNAE